MKKLFMMLVILISPLYLMAYSEKVIPGGENIGIEIETNGLVVVGFYKVEGTYIGEVNNNLYLVFSKDNKYLNYEEYIK